MTDDKSKSIDKKPKDAQAPSSPLPPKKNTATESNISSTMAQSNTKTPEPQIKKVDIAIAGVTYPIFCP
ncbi:MAG: cell division protein ZapA, partial [Psychrobacter sp.]